MEKAIIFVSKLVQEYKFEPNLAKLSPKLQKWQLSHNIGFRGSGAKGNDHLPLKKSLRGEGRTQEIHVGGLPLYFWIDGAGKKSQNIKCLKGPKRFSRSLRRWENPYIT